jgi:hypothetical protein
MRNVPPSREERAPEPERGTCPEPGGTCPRAERNVPPSRKEERTPSREERVPEPGGTCPRAGKTYDNIQKI